MEIKKKIKVCYATHLPNLTGASQSLLDMLEGLDKSEIEPIVLLGKKGPLLTELQSRGIKTKVIPYSTEISTSKVIVNSIKKLKSRLSVHFIQAFFKSENIDIVHNNSMLVWPAMKAASTLKIPFICHVRDLIWEDHKIKLLHEDEQYEFMSKADRTLFISNFVSQHFQKKFVVEHPYILVDGIKIDRYLMSHLPLFSADKISILLAGRIAPGKGQLEAIKAIEILNHQGYYDKITLEIIGGIGSQNYYDEIVAYISEKSLSNISITEFSDLTDNRSKADIALVCSSNEALGRVTIESMLSGCLVIGADSGATTELIIDKKTGLLYESGNARHLAEKIICAIENQHSMREIAQSGQKWAKSFADHRLYGEKISEIYQEIVGKDS